jgi:hypothetical protein
VKERGHTLWLATLCLAAFACGESERRVARPVVVLESPQKDRIVSWGNEIEVRATITNVLGAVVVGLNGDVIARGRLKAPSQRTFSVEHPGIR